MANERLRSSMRRNGLASDELARLTGADIKTVYRWVSPGRAPLPRHRALIARKLGEDEDWLWPDAAYSTPEGDAGSELVTAYPYRSDAPTSLWWRLFSQATQQIDLMGYTLYFLSLQHPELVAALVDKCAAGLKVRAMVGEPTSEHMAYRDREEGTPLTLIVRVQTTLAAWAPLLNVPGFELRYQDIPLYNSIFRFDDEMLMTPHLYATPGSQAPMLHLRRLGSGGLFSRFTGHFDSVWSASKPHTAPTSPGVTPVGG
jgi:hypothetical protein